MHIGNIRLPNVFEKGPVTVKMPTCKLGYMYIILQVEVHTTSIDITTKELNNNFQKHHLRFQVRLCDSDITC